MAWKSQDLAAGSNLHSSISLFFFFLLFLVCSVSPLHIENCDAVCTAISIDSGKLRTLLMGTSFSVSEHSCSREELRETFTGVISRPATLPDAPDTFELVWLLGLGSHEIDFFPLILPPQVHRASVLFWISFSSRSFTTCSTVPRLAHVNE